MFAIVGGVQRALRGREAFQEADLVGSIGRLAKWAVEIDTPARAEALVGEAVRHALAGRPGPVLIAIPEDVLDELVPGAPADEPRRSGRPASSRSRTTSGPSSSSWPAPAGRSSWPGPASSARAGRPTSSAWPRSSRSR